MRIDDSKSPSFRAGSFPGKPPTTISAQRSRCRLVGVRLLLTIYAGKGGGVRVGGAKERSCDSRLLKQTSTPATVAESIYSTTPGTDT